MNTYFRTCPDCGAHLDPGEHCDCQKEDTDARRGADDAPADQGA